MDSVELSTLLGLFFGVCGFAAFLLSILFWSKASSDCREKKGYIDYITGLQTLDFTYTVHLGVFPYFRHHFRKARLDAFPPESKFSLYLQEPDTKNELEHEKEWVIKYSKGRALVFLRNSHRVKDKLQGSDNMEVYLQVQSKKSLSDLREKILVHEPHQKNQDGAVETTVSVTNNFEIPLINYQLVCDIPSVTGLEIIEARHTGRGQGASSNLIKILERNCSIALDFIYSDSQKWLKQTIEKFHDYTLKVGLDLQPGRTDITFKYRA